ncbi:unnamed protein product [Meganyctiphanes norvegica]|uniref:Uncharacterized protein n=1 Tax=Meganyctiphanes norvegica TaxID=48144 RepID=A0AAV2RI54_MEGNR
MDKHQVLLPVRLSIGVVALVIGAAQVATAFTCFECSDHPQWSYWYLFDPGCGDFGYNGFITDTPGDSCEMIVYDDGYTSRGHDYNHREDGYCHYEPGYTMCYCKGDLCNTEGFCAQCEYPRPTPGTSTTTEATTSTDETTLTTSKPPSPTTDATSTTSPDSLACYQCVGCTAVDSSTPVISDASYQSCVTTISLSSGNVIRGASYDQHSDGECIQNTVSLFCWCSEGLCNDKTIQL